MGGGAGAAAAIDDEWAAARPPDGTTFTRRLTEAEAAGGFVAVTPDLEILEPLLGGHGHLHLTDGTVVEPDHDEGAGAVLVGPAGWLGAVRPGELVGFRLAGDEVEVLPVSAASAPEGLGDRLTAAFHSLNDGDGMPVTVTELIGTALAQPAEPAAPPESGRTAGIVCNAGTIRNAGTICNAGTIRVGGPVRTGGRGGPGHLGGTGAAAIG